MCVGDTGGGDILRVGLGNLGRQQYKACSGCLGSKVISEGEINSVKSITRENKNKMHCKNFMVVLTNKDGYLSCTFVHWTLATEQYVNVTD